MQGFVQYLKDHPRCGFVIYITEFDGTPGSVSGDIIEFDEVGFTVATNDDYRHIHAYPWSAVRSIKTTLSEAAIYPA